MKNMPKNGLHINQLLVCIFGKWLTRFINDLSYTLLKMNQFLSKVSRRIKSLFFDKPFGTQNANNRNIWLKKVLSEIPSGKTLLDAGAETK